MTFIKLSSIIIVTALSTTLNAKEYFIEWIAEDNYRLVTPSPQSLHIAVALQGAKEITIKDTFSPKCGKVDYSIPVIVHKVENALVNSEHLEYFVFQNVKGNLRPIKVINSFSTIDRETGKIVNVHSFSPLSENFNQTLCEVIKSNTHNDSKIHIINDQKRETGIKL